METKQIYEEIKNLIEPHFNHQDQMLAISHWIKDNFELKKQK